VKKERNHNKQTEGIEIRANKMEGVQKELKIILY